MGMRTALFARVARVVLVAGLALAALPAAALASTTIGQARSGSGLCGPGFVHADTNYVVPSGGGTITSFSLGGEASQRLEFLVLRKDRDGPYNYQVVGKTGYVTTTPKQQTFTANIPVRGGDILGNWSRRLLSGCKFPASGAGGYTSTGGAWPRPGVGDPVSLLLLSSSSDLNESANLVRR